MTMSALHLKADMCGPLARVCYGPIADILLLNHLVGLREQGWRHAET
jgi:hypothetical protein